VRERVRGDIKTADEGIQPSRNAGTRFIGEQQFSPAPVRSRLSERRVIIRQDYHKIAGVMATTGVTYKTLISNKGAVLRDRSTHQNNAVQPGRFNRDSFHRDTPIAEVRGKLHYTVWDRKRKEDPLRISCTALILRFNHAGYFSLCVDDVLSLEYTESRKRDVLKQDGTQ